MFADAATAARIERAEARLGQDIAGALRAAGAADALVQPIGGGAAVYVRPRSPINKLIGAGFDGPLDEGELDAVEAAWRARGEAVRVELSALVDPAAASQLAARGYRLHGFENLLGLALGGRTPGPGAPAIAVARAAPDELAEWHQATVDGFSHPDGTGVSPDEIGRDLIDEVIVDVARAPGFLRYVARMDGRLAGAATLRLDGGVAQLIGAATLPAFRRRGVQGALLAARLDDAAAAGCDVATITTAPGSQSQANSQRRGFALLYARAILIQPTG